MICCLRNKKLTHCSDNPFLDGLPVTSFESLLLSFLLNYFFLLKGLFGWSYWIMSTTRFSWFQPIKQRIFEYIYKNGQLNKDSSKKISNHKAKVNKTDALYDPLGHGKHFICPVHSSDRRVPTNSGPAVDLQWDFTITFVQRTPNCCTNNRRPPLNLAAVDVLLGVVAHYT
ncbi:hypothetical protein BD560DRAFT_493720 [Blakeslea trispora]|nr:hypothetical protein BD560DRAFT_493720 [Blakeslea trispora]